MTGDLSYKQLQEEIGRRLRELRHTVKHGLSPEDVAAEAEDRRLHIGSRTIRDWEHGKGVPTLDKLWTILQVYNVSLGDFFRFTVSGDEGRLLADFLHVIKDPEKLHAMKTLIALFRNQQHK